MDINIKRLEWDAEYWDEVAPNGATHCIDGEFIKWVDGNEYSWNEERGCWESEEMSAWSLRQYYASGISFKIIARPTKPAAPEWAGEGYPPVGCSVKFWFNSAGAGYWQEGVVIAQDGDMTVAKVNGAYYGRKTRGNLIAPIRTQADRDRDELVGVVGLHLAGDPDEIADAIIAAGYRKVQP